jgi:hypothetical protein
MALYHTTLFSNDAPGEAFVLRAAAWSFEKASGVYRGPRDKLHDYSMKLFKERGHAATANHVALDGPVFYDMEILIRARGSAQAQHAMNLLVAAIAVFEASITFCPRPFSIEPWEIGTTSHTKSYMSMIGLADACELTNRASRTRSSSYALHKLALSYQASSPDLMDLHPGRAPRRFGVQNDPIHHVYLANAVTLAYSAIEEMGLEVRASLKNPSKMPDGTWNPVVRADLERRLLKSGIDIELTHIWTLRGPKTRIERKRPPPSAGKPSWSRGNVRDVNVRVIDALALASWLRSGTTTHRLSENARSLTVYDAHNVQSLARRLILERFGFWRMLTNPRR